MFLTFYPKFEKSLISIQKNFIPYLAFAIIVFFSVVKNFQLYNEVKKNGLTFKIKYLNQQKYKHI